MCECLNKSAVSQYAAQGNIDISIWFHCNNKMMSLVEDKRKDNAQRVQTHWNPKRHIPLVSLLQ